MKGLIVNTRPLAYCVNPTWYAGGLLFFALFCPSEAPIRTEFLPIIIHIFLSSSQSGTLIGGYTEKYKSKLDSIVAECGLKSQQVRFLGQQPFEKICDELQKAHFFVFPSQEKMEGHSNSLTEAMTFGVVPIVSTAGFNASIVGKEELVVTTIDAQKYADAIEKILLHNTWPMYSRYVFQRIKENYTEDRVRKSIIESIQHLED